VCLCGEDLNISRVLCGYYVGWLEVEERRWSKKLKIGIVVLIVLGIVVGIVASNIVVADVGEAVVIIDPFAGKIVNVVFGPAWTFKAPWQYTKELYVAVKTLNFLAREGTSIDVLSKDGATISVDVTIRYEVKKTPQAVAFLISKYPIDPTGQIEREVMTPITRSVVRDVISHYLMVEVIEKREMLSKLIAQKIREKLEAEPTIKASINIIEVNVRSIRPPARVVEAIENKLRAQQEAEAAKYIFLKEIRLANATKMRQIIEAEGVKKALELIASAFGNRTDLLAWYVFVDRLTKFNGTLIIFLVPGGNYTTPPITPVMVPIGR